jgi:hypothetical protein
LENAPWRALAIESVIDRVVLPPCVYSFMWPLHGRRARRAPLPGAAVTESWPDLWDVSRVILTDLIADALAWPNGAGVIPARLEPDAGAVPNGAPIAAAGALPDAGVVSNRALVAVAGFEPVAGP